MKSISTTLQAHLSGEMTTLATCWKLTRRDGVILGFTDLDRPLTIAGLPYQSSGGFTGTALEGTAELKMDHFAVEGILQADCLSEADILSGLYDFAQIEVFQVNYRDLTQGILPLRNGQLGEITWNGTRFVAEIRGLTQALSQTIGELYSATCRAGLGDTRCKVDMASRTVTGTITQITSELIFTDISRNEPSGTFTGGKLTFLTGRNENLSVEVKYYHNRQMILCLNFPFSLQIGDSYRLTQGCDKRFETCGSRFSNVLNFRGEPYVPGIDRMLETSSTRTP